MSGKVIVNEGGEIVLYSKDKSKVLGRYPYGKGKRFKNATTAHAAAVRRERQVQFFKRQAKKDLYVTPDDLIDIAPDLRSAMIEAGIKMFPMKQIPAPLLRGLCAKYAPGRGFRTRCMTDVKIREDERVVGPKEPGAFCNWLEELCLKEGHITSKSVSLKHVEEMVAAAVRRALEEG